MTAPVTASGAPAPAEAGSAAAAGGAVSRVSVTPAAAALIRQLQAEHGALMFHQSGGCCDGSAPMCLQAGELLIGDGDVKLGEIEGVPFYMSRSQFAYWEHTHLIIDAIKGGGGMFSLEGPTGLRFLTRSRLHGDAEWAAIEALGPL